VSMFEPLRFLLWIRKSARLLSLQALDGFRRIQALAPDLVGEPLYERVLSTHLGIDDARARLLIEGARESYAEWPIARALTFSDVVHHYVAETCLKDREPERTHWIHGRIGNVVRSLIPQDL